MEIFEKDKSKVYEILKKAENLSPSSIISEVKNSGLRGRGGAGFPTGLKWELVSKEKAVPKYIVCNAHEGEPETKKDKYILENYPHLVLAGILIAGKALNVKKAYIALNPDYKKANSLLKKELSQLPGSVPCKIEVVLVEHGYIGGEESGALNEIEGKRIEPRQKPPFVSTIGLFGKPTLINNVETFANIPFIVSEGALNFKKFGTKNSPGEKLITVSGDVKKPGVYKINFGQNLNDVLKIAGGPASTRVGSSTRGWSKGKIKFALTGGFSGLVATPNKFCIPYEYDAFSKGVCVGAGTIIFYNEKTNLLGEMKKWLNFYKEQSCGQCTPCREGTKRLYEIIDRAKNKISKEDLKKIEEIFFALDNSSFCPLGMSVSMATKGLILNFRKELVSG